MVTKQPKRAVPSSRHIALLVETSTSWGADVVRGVTQYAHEHGPWFFYLEPRGRYENLHLPQGWKGDGIIARVTSQKLADELIASCIPVVNVSWYDHGSPFIPRCTVDERRCGRLGAEHFLERGFRHFAYCGPVRRQHYKDLVAQGFIETLSEADYECNIYRAKRAGRSSRSWQAQLTDLGEWLSSLPKPIGLMVWNDVRGRQVTEACRYGSIGVPEEVAVLGGEYDELMGAVSTPPLSTVESSGERVGREAAALLARLMAGKRAPSHPVFIEPAGITTRQSTDTLAIEDRRLARAIRFIREHAHSPISVQDVLKHVPMSRRKLEQQFKCVMGRSPAAEIRRVRLEKARRLLHDTDLPIPRVAIACGFNQHEVFTRAFRREVGLAPTTYRREARGGPARAPAAGGS